MLTVIIFGSKDNNYLILIVCYCFDVILNIFDGLNFDGTKIFNSTSTFSNNYAYM